jgi:hypothetical protein
LKKNSSVYILSPQSLNVWKTMFHFSLWKWSLSLSPLSLQNNISYELQKGIQLKMATLDPTCSITSSNKGAKNKKTICAPLARTLSPLATNRNGKAPGIPCSVRAPFGYPVRVSLLWGGRGLLPSGPAGRPAGWRLPFASPAVHKLTGVCVSIDVAAIVPIPAGLQSPCHISYMHAIDQITSVSPWIQTSWLQAVRYHRHR